jgi:hypothetical protein
MSIVKSIGEQVRSSVSFLAFQGKNPDFELMKEVFDALKTFIESENCEKINKVAWKIDHKYIASEEFSFIGMDQHKFVCSILLYVFCRFYRSKYNKHGNELIKITDYEDMAEQVNDIIEGLRLELMFGKEEEEG